jgi:hypothetical protein
MQASVYFHILFSSEPWNLAVRKKIVITLGGSGIFPRPKFYGRQVAAELQIVRLIQIGPLAKPLILE